VTTTRIDVLTKEQKEAQRQKIAKDVEEYLANGGTITQCPRNAYTELDADDGEDGVKKKVKFKRYLSPDSLTNPITRIIGGFKKPTKGDIE